VQTLLLVLLGSSLILAQTKHVWVLPASKVPRLRVCYLTVKQPRNH
jgi:hypothetical protein